MLESFHSSLYRSPNPIQGVVNNFSERIISDGGVIESTEYLTEYLQTLYESGLYNKASLILTANAYKERKLYSVVPEDGTGDFAFTRNGVKIRQGVTYVESVPYNLVSWSERISIAPWSFSNVTPTANAIANPITGEINATLINLSGGGVANYFSQVVPGVDGVVTISLCVKAGTQRYCQLLFGSGSAAANIDMLDGVTNVVSGGGTATSEDLGDGWFRFIYTCSVSSPLRVDIAAVPSFTSGRFASTTNTGNYYVFGYQYNIGEFKPYQRTTDRFNVPAINHGLTPSISLEPARTNTVLRSQELDNSYWTKSAVSAIADATVAPDGSTSAEKIIESASNSFHYIWRNIAWSGVYTCSVYVKAGERFRGQFYIVGGLGGSNFNLQTGTFGNGLTGEDVGNGWYRVSFTTASLSTTAALQLLIFADDGTTSYLGDGTSGFYAWGWQVESGAYLTSYFPTTTAIATRAADAVTALSNIGSLIGQTEGTIYFEGTSFADGVEKSLGLSLNGSTANRIVIRFVSSNRIQLVVVAGNTTQAILESAPFTTGTLYKIAGTYGPAGIKLFINGSHIETDTIATIPACNRFTFNRGDNVSPFYGTVKGLAIFPTALSDLKVIELTTLG